MTQKITSTTELPLNTADTLYERSGREHSTLRLLETGLGWAGLGSNSKGAEGLNCFTAAVWSGFLLKVCKPI